MLMCHALELQFIRPSIYTGANAKSASDADTLGRGVRMNEKAPDVVLVAYDTAVAHMVRPLRNGSELIATATIGSDGDISWAV